MPPSTTRDDVCSEFASMVEFMQNNVRTVSGGILNRSKGFSILQWSKKTLDELMLQTQPKREVFPRCLIENSVQLGKIVNS
jgi:hypothetical protein